MYIINIITYEDDKADNEEANPHTGDDGDILQQQERICQKETSDSNSYWIGLL